MIEMRMGMENVTDDESELVQLLENSFVRSAGIDDDRLLCHRISNDRTIATERRDGKGFSDYSRHRERMLPPTHIRAQAAALRPVLLAPEWSR